MPINWNLVLNVVIGLSVCLALFLVAFFSRSFLKRIVAPTFQVEFTPDQIENLPANAPERILAQSRQKLEEGLKEESREKLENIRLALEAEQVNQLIRYHANSLAQAQLSFRFSIAAACVGFLIIILGTVQVYFVKEFHAPLLTLVAGAIIDSVAALFFAQSNQARKSMTEFFDKLRVDRQFNESLRLCESIPDIKLQSEIKAQLCLYFAGIRESWKKADSAAADAGLAGGK